MLQYAFGISKVEANGLTILLPLILFIILLPTIIRSLAPPKITVEDEILKLDHLIAKIEIDSVQVTPLSPVYVYKSFDPNKVSAQALQTMGLKTTVVNNWLKYLKHGGRFSSAEDVKKIYGVNDSIFDVLQPYVKIAVKKQPPDQSLIPKKQPKKSSRKTFRPRIQPFDLNTADTTTLQQIRGIGPVLSKRIVKYREILGGFIHKRQLKEVYGLKDSVLFQMDTLVYLTSALPTRFVDINIASDEKLRSHPYISHKEARAVINYRLQHGSFQVLEDLYNIHLLDSLKIAKIAPYLKF